MAHPILFFYTQHYYPDFTTTAVIMRNLCEDLASFGFEVKVITAQPTYLTRKRCPKYEIYKNVEIRRVPAFRCNKNSVHGRILNSTSCFMSMLCHLLTTRKVGLFVLNTNPALLPLLGFVAAKLLHQRYLILVHDLWPELPANTKMIKKDGIIYKLIDLINTTSFKYANGIVAISDAMKNRILQKVPKKRGHIHVIPNWADENIVYPVNKKDNQLLKQLGLSHKKVIMYSGNLGRYQPLEVIVGAAVHFRHRADVVFVFAGEGAKKQKIKKMAASLRLNNVMLLPFQPLSRLAESLSMADVSLVGIYPENEGVVMPSKLYGLLAVKKPIICISHPKSEIFEVLKDTRAGLNSPVDDASELAQNITSLLDDIQKAEEMGCSGRNYFLNNFERKKITMRWKDLLESLNLFDSQQSSI